MTDGLTKEQRHKNMQHIKSKDTKVERMLRNALWHKGIRYRKNFKELPGTPDIAITKYKIAVFCDSEFFHGREWESLKKKLMKGDNGGFWIKKIYGNILHDDDVNKKLFFLGWKVVRFWDTEIKKNIQECIRTVEEAIEDAKLQELGD
jgi:DNA mismatch endonuclease (patch repair protein)